MELQYGGCPGIAFACDLTASHPSRRDLYCLPGSRSHPDGADCFCSFSSRSVVHGGVECPERGACCGDSDVAPTTHTHAYEGAYDGLLGAGLHRCPTHRTDRGRKYRECSRRAGPVCTCWSDCVVRGDPGRKRSGTTPAQLMVGKRERRFGSFLRKRRIL